MYDRPIGIRAVRALALVGVAAGLAGCAAKVKRTEFNSEMARLREEIATSDHQLAARVDSTNQANNQANAATNKLVADHTRRLEALDQEFQAFRTEFKVSMEKMKTMLKFDVPVHFEFAKGEVRDSDKVVLDRFANVVKEYYPGALVTVEGFTDPAGSASYNKRLGQKRADAVKDYLVATAGIDANHVKAVSYGEARNRQVMVGAAGPGDRGIANRRVALVIDHPFVETDSNKVSMR
jgi:peptidoglycan-associated lipoprotein